MAKMSVYLLKIDDAMARWRDIEKVLAPAMRFSQGKYQLTDIYEDVRSNYAQAWIAESSAQIHGVAITQIVRYPRKVMLFITMLAGKDFCLWDNIVNDCLIPYAKQHGCDGIEFLGRPGWDRRAKPLGFNPALTVFELNLKDIGGH